jgi:hypothetical protein
MPNATLVVVFAHSERASVGVVSGAGGRKDNSIAFHDASASAFVATDLSLNHHILP